MSSLITTPGTTPAGSFVQRLLSVTIQKADNPENNQPVTFTGNDGVSASNSNTLTISGARMSVRISNAGAPTGSTAVVTIYGLTMNVIRQLNTLGYIIDLLQRNTLIVQAGPAGSVPATVFGGTIWNAYPDFNSPPSNPFILECFGGLINAVVPADPLSFPGAFSVESAMQNIAAQMNRGFENSGVSMMLPSGSYPGSLADQWQEIADDAGIEAYDDGFTLAIWPRNGSRNGVVPVVSPGTGMIGYPTFMTGQVVVKTLFNPQLRFGGQISVEGSILQPANKIWNVYRLDHALDTLTPNGQWESTVSGTVENAPTPQVT